METSNNNQKEKDNLVNQKIENIKHKLQKINVNLSVIARCNESDFQNTKNHINYLIEESEKEQNNIAHQIKESINILDEAQKEELGNLIVQISDYKKIINERMNQLVNSDLDHQSEASKENNDQEIIEDNKEIEKNVLIKKNNINIYSLLKFIAIGIPIILFLYIGYHAYKSYNYKATYKIDFNESKFRDKNLNLYIDEDPKDIKFGAEVIENDLKYHELIGSPVNLVFQPQEYLWNKSINLKASIKDAGDWQIRMICNECTDTTDPRFSWQPFYYGSMKDYQVIAKFGDINIYSKDTIASKPASNIEEWLKTNIANGSSMDIKDQVMPFSKIVNPNIDYKPNINTEINKTLRGPHDFYVYLKDNLKLEVIKKDLNNIEGKDEVNFSISDIDNNLISQFIIEDDGIDINDPNSFSGPIKKSFDLKIDKEGVYKLSFKDAGPAKMDWLIKYIKINTNKIIIAGQSLILDPAELYTEISEDKNITVHAWHGGAAQTINISSKDNEQNIEISKKDIGLEKNIFLTRNQYVIKFDGDQYIRGANMSFSKENYFEPFIYDLSKTNSQKTILSSYIFEKTDNDWVNVKNTNLIDLSNTNKVIRYQLRNPKLESIYKQKKNLSGQGMYPLNKFQDYELWGKKDLKVYNSNASDLVEYLLNSLPDGSSVKSEDYIGLDQNYFTNSNTPQGFQKSDQYINELNFNLRGTHEFYLYIDGMLKSQIDLQDLNILDGADDIKISLINNQNQVKCQQSVSDDNNTTSDKQSTTKNVLFECDNLESGIYILKIEGIPSISTGIDSDFATSKIIINTNKIMLKDKVYSLDPIDLYTNNYGDSELNLSFWSESKVQTIEFIGKQKNKVDLDLKTLGKQKKHVLNGGNERIIIPKGGMVMSGSNFAFKSENWFDPFKIKLTNANVADFVIIYNNNQTSYLKQIELNVY